MIKSNLEAVMDDGENGEFTLDNVIQLKGVAPKLELGCKAAYQVKT